MNLNRLIDHAFSTRHSFAHESIRHSEVDYAQRIDGYLHPKTGSEPSPPPTRFDSGGSWVTTEPLSPPRRSPSACCCRPNLGGTKPKARPVWPTNCSFLFQKFLSTFAITTSSYFVSSIASQRPTLFWTLIVDLGYPLHLLNNHILPKSSPSST